MNEQFTYIPRYVRQIADYNYGETITHEAYNALMNLNSDQGDYNTEVLKTLLSVEDSTQTFHVPYLDKELEDVNTLIEGINGTLTRHAEAIADLQTATSDLPDIRSDISDLKNSVLTANNTYKASPTNKDVYTSGYINALTKNAKDTSSANTRTNYSASYLNNELGNRYTKLETYNKTEVDNKETDIYSSITNLNTYLTTNYYNKDAIETKLSNYYTKGQTYNKTEVNNLIAQLDEFKIEIVQTLPTHDIDTHTIYLVPKTGSGTDVYDEYLYVNNQWELIGNTAVDLSNYYTKSETNTLLNAKADSSSLATVATSGSYNDLTNLPTIPTVNNATLTIQKNSTTVDTFTANASVDKTINISVPTNTSDLNNDSGFVTASTIPDASTTDIDDIIGGL